MRRGLRSKEEVLGHTHIKRVVSGSFTYYDSRFGAERLFRWYAQQNRELWPPNLHFGSDRVFHFRAHGRGIEEGRRGGTRQGVNFEITLAEIGRCS